MKIKVGDKYRYNPDGGVFTVEKILLRLAPIDGEMIEESCLAGTWEGGLKSNQNSRLMGTAPGQIRGSLIACMVRSGEMTDLGARPIQYKVVTTAKGDPKDVNMLALMYSVDEIATLWPNLADIVLDPKFAKITYTIGSTTTQITPQRE